MIRCSKLPFTTPSCSLRWHWSILIALLVCIVEVFGALDSCGAPAGRVLLITANCAWREGLPALVELPGAQAGPFLVQGSSAGAAGPLSFPTVSVAAGNSNQQQVQAVVSSGWALHVEGVTLQGVTLSDPIAVGSAFDNVDASLPPVLWPHGMFSSTGSSLLLRDVRLVTSVASLQQHLAYFRAELGSTWQLYTDNSTFLHVTSWISRRTILQSVTVMAGACTEPQTLPVGATSGEAAAAAAPCGVFTASNASLVPLLAEQGRVSSLRQLLVLLQQNATLNSSVQLQRPVALVGLVSAVTSIDFGMRVNQLDVTSPHASLAFSSLVLENNAPGDVQSALVAAPFSVVTTISVWSVYCFRDDAARPCALLQNVTLVIGERDLDYITLMFSMFSSPLPGVKRMTDFFSNDLKFTHLDFAPGPGPNAVTVVNASSSSWECLDCVLSSDRVVAPPLPSPVPPFMELDTNDAAAPLVVQVYSCESVEAAILQRTIPSRLHVWLVTNSIDLAPAAAVNSSHELAGLPPAVLAADARRRARQSSAVREAAAMAPAGEALAPAEPRPTCLGKHPIIDYRTQVRGSMPGQVHGGSLENMEMSLSLSAQIQGMPKLGFAYTRNAIILPSQQPGQLTFFDMVLWGLPQGATPTELAAASVSGLMPPEAWTVLLWSVNSTVTARAVRFHGCVMMLPEPEYAQLAGMAARNRAFMIELHEHPDALTFKDATQHDNHLHVGWVEGPGVLGENLTLVADKRAVQDMPGGYYFDSTAAERASNIGATRQAAIKPQVVVLAVVVPVIVLLCIGVAAWMWTRRQRQQQQLRQLGEAYPAAAATRPGSSRTSEDVVYATNSFPDTPASGWDNKSRSQQPALGQQQQLCLKGSSVGGSGGVCRQPANAGSAVHLDVQPALVSSGRRSRHSASAGSDRAADHAGSGRTSSSPAWRQKQAHDSSSILVLGVEAAGADARTAGPPQPPAAAAPVASSVASGLQRWRAAVNSTTVNLIQRRLVGDDGVPGSNTSSKTETTSSPEAGQQRSSGDSSSGLLGADAVPLDTNKLRGSRSRQLPGDGQSLAAAAAAGSFAASGSSIMRGSGGLQLRRQLGQGSFGAVYLGTWQGNTVAVKVIHLPTGFLEENGHSTTQQQQQQPGSQQRPGRGVDPPACPPHYAIIEAVLSSMMSHPNIVQVYTFMLTPMLSRKAAGEEGSSSSSGACSAADTSTIVGDPGVGSTVADIAAAARAAAKGAAVSGWALKLIMEYCDEGTLREALDKRRRMLPGQALVAPAAVTLLLRDVAAAMLHLHSEGIVHGDLKAANVMLSSGRSDPDDLWVPSLGKRLTAKVADFGLAVPLGPADSHASLTARGTPTHMSPELFLSGRVSKASDVYSFGVCVYELVTGLRAFAGVPLPLLPHEVAVGGLRPEWPKDLGRGYSRQQAMAEACWAQDARERPCFDQIFDALQSWALGRQEVVAPWEAKQPARQQQEQRELQQAQQQQEQSQLGAANTRITFQAMQAQQLQQHQQWLAQRQQQQEQEQPARQGPGQDALQSSARAAAKPAAGGFSAAAAAAAAAAARPAPAGGLSRFGRIAWSEVSFDAAAANNAGTGQQGSSSSQIAQRKSADMQPS